MRQQDRIFVAGHSGFVGAAIVRRLVRGGCINLLLAGREDLDLTHAPAVDDFFAARRPQVVVLAASRAGGPLANATYPVDFLLDNLRIQTNVIAAAWRYRVRKLVLLAAPSVYPLLAPAPVRESTLLGGPLDPRREGDGLARIAGIKLCQAYRRQYGFDAISLVPAVPYGPGMDFDPLGERLLPSLIRRIHEAQERGVSEVMLPFAGASCRELLHVDDLADAVVHLAGTHQGEEIVNIGTGEDASIREIADLVGEAVGYRGRILTDPACTGPAPRQRLDVARLRRLGWRHRTALRDGIAETYRWFVEHAAGAHR